MSGFLRENFFKMSSTHSVKSAKSPVRGPNESVGSGYFIDSLCHYVDEEGNPLLPP